MSKERITKGLIEVITRYVTRNGRRIYPKNCKYLRFFVTPEQHEEYLKRKHK